MEIEKINAHTAVIRLAETVDDDDFPTLQKLLEVLYDDGVQVIHMDFALTEQMRKSCLGPLVMYQMKLKNLGGEIRFINVTGSHVKHLFEMLDIHRVISIEEAAV